MPVLLAAGLANAQFGGKGNGFGGAQNAAQNSGQNNNNNNNNNNANNNANSGSNSANCLDPSVISSNAANTGLQNAESGQAASATSNNNFIDFCKGKTITNGLQVKGGSCNPIRK